MLVGANFANIKWYENTEKLRKQSGADPGGGGGGGGGSRGSRGSSEPPLAGESFCTTTPPVDKHQN